MNEPSTFVGLDTHKDSISVALLRPGSHRPQEWKVVNEPKAVRRLARQLAGEPGTRTCYEAGPGGYVLQRQLAQGDRFDSCGEAKMELFDYIEVFYNQKRRHSTIGQVSPAAFEKARATQAA